MDFCPVEQSNLENTKFCKGMKKECQRPDCEAVAVTIPSPTEQHPGISAASVSLSPHGMQTHYTEPQLRF